MIDELDGGTMGKVSPTSAATYEPPSLRVLGSVHALTQSDSKRFGSADGFVFQPLTNAS